MLEKEVEMFDKNLSDLIKTDFGKYVLIKEDRLVGTYVAIEDALKAGYQNFGKQAFFVRQILPFQEPLSFVNNQFFA